MGEAYLRAKALLLRAMRPKPKGLGYLSSLGRDLSWGGIAEEAESARGSGLIRVKFNFAGRDLVRGGNVKRGGFRLTLGA